MAKQWVYAFGEHEFDKDLLGGKGANLGEMTKIGLPVPPGFTITTEACRHCIKEGKPPADLDSQVMQKLAEVEKKTNKKFGDAANPLLFSVRSGAKFSMPGMMDTVLNIGLNDATAAGLAKKSGNERFAFDSYRRLVQMFGDVVLGVEHKKFEAVLDSYKKGRKDTDLTVNELKQIVREYKELVKKETKKPFPDEPAEQLKLAINAVFESWNTPRANVYRKLNNIPDDLGTAVNVQAMVFGNRGANSGTGVAFTRNPATGAKEHYGEYLVDAQGEDVVAGIRTPKPVDEMKKDLPAAYAELLEVYDKLEKHYKEMQDFEFTIEGGKLYMLQTRTGKRTAQAAVKIAVDMVKEALIDKETAVMRVEPNSINQLLHEQLDPTAELKVIAKGLAASPGAAVGRIVFNAEDAQEWAAKGEKVILARNETSPEDIAGMAVAKGILTARGGMTSHAAVVARGMGKCCVAGCNAVRVDEKTKKMFVGDREFEEGAWISLDGDTGRVIQGQVKTVPPALSGDFGVFMQWADSFRRLRVRANADTPVDAKRARDFGAEGIGLCRTEHMFFGEDRLPWMQKMILAKDAEGRREALGHLLEMQREDFKGLFKAMDGLPVTIRLLDPPLHEFLPSHEELLVEITKLKATKGSAALLREKEVLLKRVEELKEINPMLGNRGCRLGITLPDVTRMQVRAIIEAAIECEANGVKVKPEIEVPLVSHVNELKFVKQIIDETAECVFKERGKRSAYKVGTMIELPRATLTADEIAEYAEFMSFGTNDLTQTTFGFSRDDAEGKFLHEYVEAKILDGDPFAVIDRGGVGKLIKMTVELGRKTKPKLEIGICGEQGGEPNSVEFCHIVGLDYVSCSPFRVPIARLAAAQAGIRHKKQ
ncbi:pyruvate, phosphate dikinase [Candidatus Micrarchaeota archaeon CG_4_10_14_0_2_um_filter_60_11]|nr:MAG: pyruvate, phosphate dikinase [Candidatus Micrarchaeota archaeon CG_4_10_14_0_2_um_filter_60_11]